MTTPFTRRSLLKRLVTVPAALLVLPLANRLASPSVCPRSCGPKVGRITVIEGNGMLVRCGDWTPLIDGKPIHWRQCCVQTLDDVQGWYEGTVQLTDYPNATWLLISDGTRATARFYGNVSVRYTGNDPRFAAFKEVA